MQRWTLAILVLNLGLLVGYTGACTTASLRDAPVITLADRYPESWGGVADIRYTFPIDPATPLRGRVATSLRFTPTITSQQSLTSVWLQFCFPSSMLPVPPTDQTIWLRGTAEGCDGHPYALLFEDVPAQTLWWPAGSLLFVVQQEGLYRIPYELRSAGRQTYRGSFQLQIGH